MGKITLKNISSSTVVISVPDINFRRELIPGRVIPIKQEEYDGLFFDPGVDTLIQGHYIKFDGVEEDEQVIEQTPTYEASDIKKMIVEHDITSFSKFIPNATEAEKESVVKIAVAEKITDNGFIALIKKYCDVDVISAINIQHQLEE